MANWKSLFDEIIDEKRRDEYICTEPDLFCPVNPTYGYSKPITLNAPRLFGLDISNVIFNYPATIVFWSDGTKTVVKVQNGEKFDPEKGIAMAIAKKFFGNKGNYYNHIKKWVEKYEEKNSDMTGSFSITLDGNDIVDKIFNTVTEVCETIRHSELIAGDGV